MKTIEQSFCDWESSAFGFGYGTGEEVMGQLREMAQTIEMRCIMEGERVYFEGDKAERAVELLRRTASRPKEKDDV